MDPRRAQQQHDTTYDLRDQLITDNNHHNPPMLTDSAGAATAAAAAGGGTQTVIHDDAEPRSVLDDDSDGEEDGEDYIEDDRSSSLSIPNESIDFDLVYSLHSFAATVEGQANVVKGDRLFLIDDSNSYWWLVRVLKTQEVGYIPAENIETPFERLARLNKHRNVDVSLYLFFPPFYFVFWAVVVFWHHWANARYDDYDSWHQPHKQRCKATSMHLVTDSD